MLTAYLTQTKRLLQNPSAPVSLYSDADLTDYINIARGQIAGEAECIRVLGTVAAVVGTPNYLFSALNTGVVATVGIQGVIHVRSIMRSSSSGKRWIPPRPWEWYQLYGANEDTPANAAPTFWSQYGQGSAGTATGSAATGSFYLYPAPDATYTLTCDCVCYPLALANDATVEAIPYLWTDAVPFFAAYYAYLSAQTGARQADADRMFTRYQTFMQRARQAANPAPDKWMYSQAPVVEGVNPLAQAGQG